MLRPPLNAFLLVTGGLGLVAALMPGAVGCTATEEALVAAIGGDCLLNSDCEEGLLCVFRRCHQQCNTSADCPLDDSGENERCMLGTKPDHYCQLPDERACIYNSECPGPQICGNDGECRDQCATDKDCIEDQQCAQATCALPAELDDTGALPLADATESLPDGQSCIRDSECVAFNPDFVCLAGACRYECRDDADCPTRRCNISDGADGGRCAGTTVACVPGAQVECDCIDGTDGVQICDATGDRYGDCVDVNGMSCAPPSPP
ncbi:MAG: hypothetical protein AAF715_19190 [Myxococcota bacterium]